LKGHGCRVNLREGISQEARMKPLHNCRRFVSLLSSSPLSLHPLRTIALILPLLLGLTIAGSGTAAAQSRAHVYLFRGVMNVFSLGMDEIAAKLQKHRIEASVYNHLSWSSVAESAAADYKSGKIRTIILVGHSAGATAVTSAAERLGQLGVPVKLAIGLDPLTKVTAAGRVARYINFYVGNGAGQQVAKGRQFSGTLQNVNVEKMPNIGHFNIDKDQAVQAKVISAIRAAL
jgi:hypothetical protein